MNMHTQLATHTTLPTILTSCIYTPPPLHVPLLHTTVQDGFVGDLQQQSQLGVHGVGLLGVDSEERSVEAADVLQLAVPPGKTVQAWEPQTPRITDPQSHTPRYRRSQTQSYGEIQTGNNTTTVTDFLS